MIVGGIQDPGKVNNMHLLMYKTHDFNREDENKYEISVELKPETTNEKDFELLFNQV